LAAEKEEEERWKRGGEKDVEERRKLVRKEELKR